MAALLKDVYTKEYINNLACIVLIHYPSFKKKQFIGSIFDTDWQELELKARMYHITQQLHHFITLDYQDSLKLIQNIAPNFTSYEGMFIPAFVELFGLDRLKESMDALAYITQFASAEFAVRPFIKKHPEAMLDTLLTWTKSNNEHVRRLASEGCRPRLPWAMALPEFKKDPNFILPILDALKNDNSEYVRRSVANNLNDIAKDHPEVVTKIAKKWLMNNPPTETKRLVKHACRSLLKQALPEVLELFGFLPPKDIEVTGLVVEPQVSLGDTLHFSFQLKQVNGLSLNKLRIEFAIDFMKNNGKQVRKIFQISESVINEKTKIINKSFSFKKISTRQYYVGKHTVAILINGVQMSEIDFVLKN